MSHYIDPNGGLHFLDDDSHADSIPAFAAFKKISDAEAENVRAAKQNSPEIIAARVEGVRMQRETILNRLTGMAITAQATGGTEAVQAFIAARQGLLDITKDLPSTIAQFDAVVATRFKTIADTLPSAMRKAF